jgi:hypothetical protein
MPRALHSKQGLAGLRLWLEKQLKSEIDNLQ